MSSVLMTAQAWYRTYSSPRTLLASHCFQSISVCRQVAFGYYHGVFSALKFHVHTMSICLWPTYYITLFLRFVFAAWIIHHLKISPCSYLVNFYVGHFNANITWTYFSFNKHYLFRERQIDMRETGHMHGGRHFSF